MESQTPLVHLELNRCYGVCGRADGIVFVFITFDQVHEDIALVAFQCANLSLKYFAESSQRGVVVFFGTDRVYPDHIYTSSTFTRSYSAWVPMNFMYT